MYIYTYERVPWYEDPSFANTLFCFCILLFASVFIWPLMWLKEKRNTENILPKKGSQYALWLAGTAVLLQIAFISGLYFLLNYSDAFNAYYTQLQAPLQLILLLTIPVIASVFTVGTLICAIFVWKNKYWDLKNRLHYTLVLAALIIFMWWLNFWNLLGYNF